MKINVKKLLLLTILICICCTGSAYASNVASLSFPSFNPQPPFWPGEHIDVTTTVYPAEAGVHVQLQSELGGFFAEGYTDSSGRFTGVYLVPDNALEWAQYSYTGGIRFSAYCPEAGIQSGDISCEVIANPEESGPVAISQTFSPQPPFWPGEQVTVTASVEPAQSGVYVQLQCEGVGFYAEGYTDTNGKFTGTFTCPNNALELAQSASNPGGLYFSAVCPTAQSIDTYCYIVPPTPPSGPAAISQSFSSQPPFWPGEQVDVTASVVPAQSGVYVQLQCEGVGFYAEGYTDANGKFTGTFTCPNNALELAQSSSNPGGLYFSAVCPTAQSIDTYCSIVSRPAGPELPEFPSMVLPVVAILGLVFIFGRRKT